MRNYDYLDPEDAKNELVEAERRIRDLEACVLVDPETVQRYVDKLNAISADTDCIEAHGTADEFLLDFLDVNFPEVSAAYRAVRERVGFYYS